MAIDLDRDDACAEATAPQPAFILEDGWLARRLQPGQPAWSFWRTHEVATLRALYPSGGSAAVYAALPYRSLSSIRAKANTLGVACQLPSTQGMRFARKYPPSEYLDQRIRDGYAAARSKGDYARLADALGRPRWWVQKRAAALGVTRTTQTRLDAWQADEVALVERWATCTLPIIRKKLAQAGFRRSETAVAIKLKRLRVDRTDPDAWAPADLAQLLGVDPNTVRDWIDRRGLPAVERAAGQQTRLLVRRKALRGWLKRNPRYVDLRRVDQPWFMDLVLGPAAS